MISACVVLLLRDYGGQENMTIHMRVMHGTLSKISNSLFRLCTATMIKFVLKLLEELDRYDYNKATRLGSVEELYEKLFVLEYGSNVQELF